MATIRFAKVVANLPATLEPNTLYLVRVGSGFDLYASDMTGSVAYLINKDSPTSSTNLGLVYAMRLNMFVP
jgi:hypothetical protein